MDSSIREPEIESKRSIRAAAYRLLWERGYEATSYSVIASACGLGRSLVQKHFPKKEQLLCDLTEDILANCKFVLDKRGLLDHTVESDALRIAQIFYSALLQNATSIRLARQALAQEGVSTRVVTMLTRYTHEIGFDDDVVDLRHSVVLAAGGVGGLVVDETSRGEAPDPDHIAMLCVTLLLVVNADAGFSVTKEELRGYLLPSDAVDSIVEEVVSRTMPR